MWSFGVVLLAAAAALISYRLIEEWGRRSWLPATLRAVGWSALALLLVNASCPVSREGARPVVVLDASLSMQAAGGRWDEALALARRLGEVRFAGAALGDSTPVAGRSALAPAAAAAAGSGRRVVVVTDGEVEDAHDLVGDPATAPEIQVLPRRPIADAALRRVQGTTRLTPSDSLRIDVEITSSRGPAPAALPARVTVEAREGNRTWLRGVVPLDSAGRGTATLVGPVPPVAPGVHPLSVVIADAADSEPRNDARILLIHVAATPGVVLLASPPSWESRFLAAALRDVSALPVRGYLETEPGKWRRTGDLRVVGMNEVADAARRADLLVDLSTSPELSRGTRARGRWSWLTGATAALGDWYVASASPSPLSGALSGLPVDSFPPGTAAIHLAAGPRDWVGLTAQLGRRGMAAPVLLGRDSGGVRQIQSGIDGLWRWAFRGGSSEQGYRSLVASAVSWLLGGADVAVGKARPEREVVQRGLPLVFEWTAGGTPAPLAVQWVSDSVTLRDTLSFDGRGRAEAFLPPGVWRYRLDGGTPGTVAVESYSEEWVPRPVAVSDRPGAPVSSRSERPARGWIWLFGLAAVAFAGEWAARRRLGLR